jgi:aspartyl-tRNA(Asn)/glutamyl-tRNA(Gln) amidotransferase subunit B
VIAFAPVIGLEIHAQLLTASKIFCGCSTKFGAPPNTHVCPVCLGLPGALPALNHAAADAAIRAALALNCTIHHVSIFARKNYFYPDLPKGYQISQYERPLATDGLIAARFDYWAPEYDIRIKRVHLEEDAGKLLHEGFRDSDEHSYVDLNRAGTPLIEIVTEPDFRSAKDAAAFFGYLRELLMAIGVNDGNMEEGSLRCDANVSVRPADSASLGTKSEIKNLNSFRFVEKAVDFEIGRQIAELRAGGRVVQETRLWDAAGGRTFAMRSKEEADDYRYFPEPDLPPLLAPAERIEAIRNAMPELPATWRRRLQLERGLGESDAVALTLKPGLGRYFEDAVAAGAPPKPTANFVMGSVLTALNERGTDDVDVVRAKVPAPALADLVALVERGAISHTIGKEVFARMFATGRSAGEIVEAEGLTQIEDESKIAAVITDVLGRNADAVAQFGGGKTNAFGFLVGQVMKATGGKANPRRVNELLRRALGTGGAGKAGRAGKAGGAG